MNFVHYNTSNLVFEVVYMNYTWFFSAKVAKLEDELFVANKERDELQHIVEKLKNEVRRYEDDGSSSMSN